MHIELETLPNCITSMRVELPPERVAKERQTILRDYQGAARLPGYRPGKAPAKLVEAKYRKEIGEELQRKLVTAGTREAIAEKGLKVLSLADVEEVSLGQDDALKFTAKLITAPEFNLPPYQSLPVKTPPPEISEGEIDATIERLRARLGDFKDIEGRGLEMGDFCVVDFATRFEDKPLAEAVPGTPKELAGQENFWIKLGPQTLIPGFSDALLGAVADETRTFALDVPADFPLADPRRQAPRLHGEGPRAQDAGAARGERRVRRQAHSRARRWRNSARRSARKCPPSAPTRSKNSSATRSWRSCSAGWTSSCPTSSSARRAAGSWTESCARTRSAVFPTRRFGRTRRRSSPTPGSPRVEWTLPSPPPFHTYNELPQIASGGVH